MNKQIFYYSTFDIIKSLCKEKDGRLYITVDDFKNKAWIKVERHTETIEEAIVNFLTTLPHTQNIMMNRYEVNLDHLGGFDDNDTLLVDHHNRRGSWAIDFCVHRQSGGIVYIKTLHDSKELFKKLTDKIVKNVWTFIAISLFSV